MQKRVVRAAGVVLPVLVLVVWGLVVRMQAFAPDRSLWLDEASLGMSIHQLGFRRMLMPLLFNQAAPLLFLYGERLMYLLLGPSDWVLRVLPWVANAASLPMIYVLARQNGSRHFAWLALALVVASPEHVRYSGELKQYSLDVLVAAFLMWVFGECLARPQDLRAHRRLAWAGAVAVWASHPSLFVLAGLGFSVALVNLRRWRDWPFVKLWLWIALAWLASFALLYFVNLRFVAANDVLVTFWKRYFAPLPPWSHGRWYAHSLSGNVRFLFTTPGGWVTTGALLLGLASLLWRRTALALAVLLTLLLTLIASSLQHYPFHGRFLLFLIPGLCLVLAESVDRLRQWAARWSRPASALLFVAGSAFLLSQAVQTEQQQLASHYVAEDIKPVMADLAARRQSGDQIYVYYGAVPAFEFYAPQYGVAEASFIPGGFHRSQPAEYLTEIDAHIGEGRVWVVFAHNCDHCARKVNEQQFIVQHLDGRGQRLYEHHEPGSALFLFDLGATARVTPAGAS